MRIKLFSTGLLFLLSYCLSTNAQSVLWAKGSGGLNYDYSQAVSVSASGNEYITGCFTSSSITFGTTTLSLVDTYDIFLAKYDAMGNVIWARSAGGTRYDIATAVATDAAENIYITGYFNSPFITFGTTTLTNASGYDMFLAKYDSTGNVVWARSSIGPGSFLSYSVTCQGAFVYITGYTAFGPITIGSDTIGSGLNSNVVLAKYDSSGNVSWVKSASSPYGCPAYSVTTDIDANIYIAGLFNAATITFGSITLSGGVNDDMFLVKYDPEGNVLWARKAGGIGGDAAKSVITDALGNVYVAGYFFSPTITFDTITLTNSLISGLTYDIFLAKYNSLGSLIWAKSAGGIGYDDPGTIGLDSIGNIYLTGTFYSSTGGLSTITFDTVTLTNSYMFLTKYSSSGHVIWVKKVGDTCLGQANAVTTDGCGNIYLTGTYGCNSITLGIDTLINAGGGDLFLVKYSPTVVTVPSLYNPSTPVRIYPNPNEGNFTILFQNAAYDNLKIFDCLGQQLYSCLVTGKESETISLSNIPIGVYNLQVCGHASIETVHFVVR